MKLTESKLRNIIREEIQQITEKDLRSRSAGEAEYDGPTVLFTPKSLAKREYKDKYPSESEIFETIFRDLGLTNEDIGEFQDYSHLYVYFPASVGRSEIRRAFENRFASKGYSDSAYYFSNER